MATYKNISNMTIILANGTRIPANGMVDITEQEARQAGSALQRTDMKGRQLLSEAPIGYATPIVEDQKKNLSEPKPEIIEPEVVPNTQDENEVTEPKVIPSVQEEQETETEVTEPESTEPVIESQEKPEVKKTTRRTRSRKRSSK